MAAAAGEQLSFDSALAATLQDLKLTFSLRKEQRTALKSFLEKKDVLIVITLVRSQYDHCKRLITITEL